MVILKLNTHKPTTTGNIPSKVMVENHDIFSPPLCSIFNNSVIVSIFPNNLKMGELMSCHKHDDTTNKSNYRPVSILPTVSIVFERILNEQALAYTSKYLSPYLCGFCKGYSTQYSIIRMLEKWKSTLDNKGMSGALLTDLSKAFNCIDHRLLIAKLDAYGFDPVALARISSYLSNRKQMKGK